MWVADMDFESPACIKSALRKYVDNGIFGYHSEPKGLREILKKYLSNKGCLLYTSPSPRDDELSRMPSSA